jgi:hypothetical protein
MFTDVTIYYTAAAAVVRLRLKTWAEPFAGKPEAFDTHYSAVV